MILSFLLSFLWNSPILDSSETRKEYLNGEESVTEKNTNIDNDMKDNNNYDNIDTNKTNDSNSNNNHPISSTGDESSDNNNTLMGSIPPPTIPTIYISDPNSTPATSAAEFLEIQMLKEERERSEKMKTELEQLKKQWEEKSHLLVRIEQEWKVLHSKHLCYITLLFLFSISMPFWLIH